MAPLWSGTHIDLKLQLICYSRISHIRVPRTPESRADVNATQKLSSHFLVFGPSGLFMPLSLPPDALPLAVWAHAMRVDERISLEDRE